MGENYQFVGSQTTGSGCSQLENEGHDGWTIAQLAGIEHCTITGYMPNLVLLDAGTNDINSGGDPGTASTALENLVNNIINDDPNATVAVSSLIPTSNATVAANMDTFNDDVFNWVEQQQGSGRRVVWADQNAIPVEPSELADGLHPNDTGYSYMAANWAQAIGDADIQNIVQPAAATNGNACGQPVWVPKGQIASGFGTGSDQPGSQPLPAGAHIQFADINGDGKADYLQINADGSVDAWLNNGFGPSGGAPVWKPLGQIASGVGAPGSEVQFARIAGSGRADYVVVDPTNGAATMWQNDGTNASGQYVWESMGQIFSPFYGPANLQGRITFADINGDGKDDYLWIDNSGNVEEWENEGPASGGGWNWNPTPVFTQGSESPEYQGVIASDPGGVTSASQVQFADINDDGHADYLMVNPNNGAVTAFQYVSQSSSTGVTWSAPILLATGVGDIGANIQFADVFGSGVADYLDVNPANGTVAAWQNFGPNSTQGWNWTPRGQIVSGVSSQVQFADIWGSGRDDYLKVNADGSVQDFMNTGTNPTTGLPVWGGSTTIALGVGDPGSDIVLAPVFGTGRADYLDINPTTGAVTAWENGGSNGAGGINWISKGQIAAGVGAPGTQVRFADVWGTGRDDYLTIDPNTGAINDYVNTGTDANGNIVWVPNGTIATGVGVPGSQVRLAPIYGTGKADYLAVGADSSVQAWKNNGATGTLGNGSWNWNPEGTIASGVGVQGNQVQFADIWGTGRDAYLVVNADGSVTAWQNAGLT